MKILAATSANKIRSQQYSAIISTPIGNLGLCASQGFITRIGFVERACSSFIDDANPVIARAIDELEWYFTGRLKHFQTPFFSDGTLFQRKVWHSLATIPYGQTLTYGQLADKLKTSPRAIGNACRTNPLLIIVPCHRVLAHNGLGGFSGETRGQQIAVKRWLLDLETIMRPHPCPSPASGRGEYESLPPA